MRRKTSMKYAAALVAACFASAASGGDLPKSGTYNAHFAWTFSGQVQELGPNRVVYSGGTPGVVFNDAGKGFMHQVRIDCTIFSDVNQGRATANGTCVTTDAQGDKAYLEWKCAGDMPVCPGEFRWVGGTGKYTGLTGTSRFQGNFIGATGAGWSDWSGDYKLP